MPVKGGAGELSEPAEDTAGNMSLRESEKPGPITEDAAVRDTEDDAA